jgi:protein-disulfide isomerase
MVLCFIGLFVFAILGIFSAKYRSLAKEAFACVWNRMRFKPCQGTLDDRIRREILSKAFRLSPTLTKYINKYYELLEWLFVIIFIVSFFFMAQGIYNYAIFGNCNGPQGGFCIFDPLGSGHTNSSAGNLCVVEGNAGKTVSLPTNLGNHIIGKENAKVTLVEVGCYTCPFTKKAQPEVNKILGTYIQNKIGINPRIKFAFISLPLPDHAFSKEASEAAECASDQGKFWEYHNELFERQDAVKTKGNTELIAIAGKLNLNMGEFNVCLIDSKYGQKIQQNYDEGVKEGIYGTPTFFINNRVLVGPQSEQELAKIIEEELRK